MQVIRLNKMAAFIVGALGVSAVGAQNVVFTNSTNSTANGPYTIQLKSGLPVTVAPNGDIKAQCELVDGTSRCVGIPVGTGGQPIDPNKPTNVSLSSNATDAGDAAGVQVAIGTAFTLSAGATNAAACVRSVSPGVAGWSGVVAPDAAGAQVSLSSIGTYTFDFKCLNDAGATSASPVIIEAIQGTVVQPPPPTGSCAPANDGFFPPTGLTPGLPVTFTQLWQTNPGPSGPNPVGSALAQVKMSGGQYRALEFRYDMLNTTNEVLTMYADTSNPGSGVAAGATWRFAAISECPGDLRQANDAAGGMLKSGCRVYISEGPFVYLNFGTPSGDAAVCNLDKNKTYYMNVTFDAPHDGFNPSQPCSDRLNSATDTCGFRMSF
jgi:hypothetical protein